MHPWFGEFPAFLVGWGLAALLGGGAAIWLLTRARLLPWQIAVAFAAIGTALLVGSKLLFLIEAWRRVVSPGADLSALLFSPQMRIPGGLALAVAIGPPLARVLGVSYLRFADAVVPAAGLLLVGNHL